MPSPAKARPKASDFPIVVERGPTGLKGTAKIYRAPVCVKGERYDSYLVTYYDQGQRRRQRFNEYLKAFSFAEEKATQLSGGELAAVSLKNEDQRIYGAAVDGLKPFGVSLELAVREYIAARKLLGPVNLLDAARFHQRFGKQVTKQGTLREILDAMLAGLEADGRSAYHRRDLKRHVGDFIAAFPSHRIDQITTADIDKWLRSLSVQGRSRDNRRDSVHNFFNYARKAGYLPKDLGTAAGDTARVNQAEAENHVFTPEEMSQLLQGAPAHLIPVLAIKAFSGVRTEELLRLGWGNIRFDQDVLMLTRDITKTKRRRIVPLLPNLRLWIEPFRQTEGRVAERWVSAHTLSKAISNRAADVGVDHKRNAMRNSYISYRLAQVKSAAQVALESGNSPAVIQESYMELVTETAAKKWFSLIP